MLQSRHVFTIIIGGIIQANFVISFVERMPESNKRLVYIVGFRTASPFVSCNASQNVRATTDTF